MDQLLLISIIAGVVLGILSLGVATIVVRLYSRGLARGLDIDLVYQTIDDFKRRGDTESEYAEEDSSRAWQTVSVWYGVGVGIVMCLLIRAILALSPDFYNAVLATLLAWLVVASLPVLPTVSHKAKQIVILDIASILERVAQSEGDSGEVWTIRSVRTVAGGDLFGEDEEDHLELRISRTEIAPVSLSLWGHVEVAEAGLQRTIRKSGLRQLRIRGWEVSEIRETEATVVCQWSLHDSTYADIARSIAEAIEALGFPLRTVRLGKANPSEEGERVS